MPGFCTFRGTTLYATSRKQRRNITKRMFSAKKARHTAKKCAKRELNAHLSWKTGNDVSVRWNLMQLGDRCSFWWERDTTLNEAFVEAKRLNLHCFWRNIQREIFKNLKFRECDICWENQFGKRHLGTQFEHISGRIYIFSITVIIITIFALIPRKKNFCRDKIFIPASMNPQLFFSSLEFHSKDPKTFSFFS